MGLQERFDEFGVELERRFGWQIDERRRLHVEFGTSPRLRTRFRRRIAKDNAYDMEFYEFAVELYERPRPRPSLTPFARVLRPSAPARTRTSSLLLGHR